MTQLDADNPPPEPSAIPLAYAHARTPKGPSLNPWHNRKRVAIWLDFWRTVIWVMARNGRLGPSLAEPAPWKDAKKFRRWCVAHAAVPTFVAGALIVASATCGDDTSILGYYAAAWLSFILPVILVTSVLSFGLMAGAVSWFFCPRQYDTERQNRSIALSCYLCAPLAIIGILGGAAALLERPSLTGHEPLPCWFAPVPLLISALWLYWWQLLLFGARSVAGRGWRGILVTAVALPATWAAIVAAGILAAWSLVMWMLMYLSLT